MFLLGAFDRLCFFLDFLFFLREWLFRVKFDGFFLGNLDYWCFSPFCISSPSFAFLAILISRQGLIECLMFSQLIHGLTDAIYLLCSSVAFFWCMGSAVRECLMLLFRVSYVGLIDSDLCLSLLSFSRVNFCDSWWEWLLVLSSFLMVS